MNHGNTNLERCVACGSVCRPEEFGLTEAVPESCVLFICNNATIRGGDCPDRRAYLSQEAWNDTHKPWQRLAKIKPRRDEATFGLVRDWCNMHENKVFTFAPAGKADRACYGDEDAWMIVDKDVPDREIMPAWFAAGDLRFVRIEAEAQ